jgi:hypothetical protein
VLPADRRFDASGTRVIQTVYAVVKVWSAGMLQKTTLLTPGGTRTPFCRTKKKPAQRAGWSKEKQSA